MATRRRAKSNKAGAKAPSARPKARHEGSAPQKTSKYEGQRSRRADGLATRARVLSAAADVFARDGFEGASLRRIAEAGGVDIATLKYHFGDKSALFTEVYRDGYQQFERALGPQLLRVPLAQNAAELEAEVRVLFERAYDYMEDHERFVRLWLFRLLESPTDVVDAEETLRANALGLIEAALRILGERRLVREVDVRVLVLLIIAAVPTLILGAWARPGLLGPSALPPKARFVDFFTEMLKRQLLLPGPAPTPSPAET